MHQPPAALLEVIDDGISKQLHHGVAVSVSLRGELLLEFARGEAAPGEPLTTDHILLWLSSGKPLTAVGIARLWEAGQLDLDVPVTRYLPGFGQWGKGQITTRHLLTHTGGFRNVEIAWPGDDWDTIQRKIAETPLEPDWIPGETAGYHVASSWFVLGELIERISGQAYREFLREQVLDPLRLTETWNGLTAEEYNRLRPRMAPIYVREKGELLNRNWHVPEWVCPPGPGGNTRGTVADLRRFYECILQALKGGHPDFLQPSTLQEMTARQREGRRDLTFQHVLDFGLGWIINSRRYGADTAPYGFGQRTSEATFGHGGAQSSIGFADPESELVVAVIANGMPGEGQHQRRNRAILQAIEDWLYEG